MPSTRARTCATRYGEVRPGSSIEIGTLPRCTVTTETCGGWGAVVAGLAAPQPARTMAANAGATPTRHSVIRSEFMRPAVSVVGSHAHHGDESLPAHFTPVARHFICTRYDLQRP